MANGTSKITRTFGTPTNNLKWTWSGWVKPDMAQEQGLFFGYVDASNYSFIGLSSTGQLQLYNHAGGGASGNKKTTALFRDNSAFYHFVVVWDSANATAGDRMKLYVNGVRETVFSSDSDPSSSAASKINGAWLHEIGAKLGSYDFSGVMSHVHFCDGQAYTPSDFGSTDATDGMWKINTAPSVTYGNNGYFLKMEDSTNLDLDSSPNAAAFSTTGSLISTKDNPSNNLCTNNWTNPTVDTTADSIKNIGNTALIQQASFRSILGTLGVQAGKWYAEFKLRTATGTSNYAGMGIVNVSQQPEYALGSASSKKIGEYGNTVAYFSGGAVIRNASTVRTDSTFTSGDIISIAMDCDNGFVYWAKNNTWQNSGDPTSGATGTGGYNFFTYLGTGGIYVMGVTGRSGASSAPYFDVNWGNGAYANANFGSPNADGNGYGAFTYAPPTGFLTMCTKNIETNG